jgi:hypothetical protein
MISKSVFLVHSYDVNKLYLKRIHYTRNGYSDSRPLTARLNFQTSSVSLHIFKAFPGSYEDRFRVYFFPLAINYIFKAIVNFLLPAMSLRNVFLFFNFTWYIKVT